MAYLERSKKPLTLFITFSSMSLMHKLIFFFFFCSQQERFLLLKKMKTIAAPRVFQESLDFQKLEELSKPFQSWSFRV